MALKKCLDCNCVFISENGQDYCKSCFEIRKNRVCVECGNNIALDCQNIYSDDKKDTLCPKCYDIQEETKEAVLKLEEEKIEKNKPEPLESSMSRIANSLENIIELLTQKLKY